MRQNQTVSVSIDDPVSRWNWIRLELGKQGKTITSLAKEHNMRPQTISNCKYKPYPKVEKMLAKAIGCYVQDVFPDRYNKDGSRKGLYHRKAH